MTSQNQHVSEYDAILDSMGRHFFEASLILVEKLALFKN